jgi:hypothetical protein
MAANVLNSRRATHMSVFVVRAFLKMRALLGDKRDLAKQLAALERTKKATRCPRGCHCHNFTTDIIDPPAEAAPPPKPRIGFNP